MDNNSKALALAFLETLDTTLSDISPRNRANVNEVMVVYIDIVNGKAKHRINSDLLEIWSSLNEGSKPIGLILVNWMDSKDVTMKEFPNISVEEQSLLHHAFAEVQDQFTEAKEW